MKNEELELIKRCYSDFVTKQGHYEDINRYYYGNTDSLANFKPMKGRSNLKVKTNFMQKLIDEEAQYSFGNDVTYIAKNDNADMLKDIDYVLENNNADHDINLGIELVKYGLVYEISYLDKNLQFKNKIVSPLTGYMYLKDEIPVYFLHMFKRQLDDKDYIDVYTDKYIYHFDTTWQEVAPATEHYFGIVPVGFGMIGGKKYSMERGYTEGDKTIYSLIKHIQDAYETNFSDMVSEISDFRNAILKLYGVELKDKIDENGNVVLGKDGKPVKEEPVVRDNCIMAFGSKTEQDAEWLIKNINDTFIKNTRDDLKDLMYVLTSHVDSNEKMASNLSGVALRSRLQSLEAKCKMNEKAMKNIIKTRLKCLFKFLYLTSSKSYDPNMVNIQFTPNVPQDIAVIADVIAKIPHDVLSNESKRAMLPNINNIKGEQDRIDNENKAAEPEVDLDKAGVINGQ